MHWQELASDLQAVIDVPNVAPDYTEVIFDPSGLNLDLSAYVKMGAPLKISKSKSILPGKFGRFTIGEVKITMKNDSDYFNHNDLDSPFYHGTSRLYADASSANSYVDIHKGDGSKFQADHNFVITGGGNTVTKIIQSVDTTTYSLYDRITLTSTVGQDFDAGSLVETPYLAGRTITLKSYYDGVTTKVEQYKGVLKSLPKLKEGVAELTIYDNFRTLLDIDLKANDYRTLTASNGRGALDNVSYSRADASTGTLTPENITIDDSKCTIGQWKIKITRLSPLSYGSATSTSEGKLIDSGAGFIFDGVFPGSMVKNTTDGTYTTVVTRDSATQLTLVDDIFVSGESYEVYDCRFTVTDPAGNEYDGNNLSPFYAGTASSYQLTWTWDSSILKGGFDKDDEMYFQTTCSLGRPVNSYDTIPNMIYKLITEDFGAGLSTAELELASYTGLIADYDEMLGAISFTQKTTVLRAIELLQDHITSTHFHTNAGLFNLSCWRPEQDPATIYEFSPSADIKELQQEDLGRIERVFVYYDFNHSTGKYASPIIIPEGADETGAGLDIYLPAYHNGDYGQARAAGERVYLMYREGMQAFEIKEKYDYGLALDIDDIVSISSNHPEFESRVVKIYDINKDLDAKDITVRAYDLHFLFGHYAFCDIDYCDRGKVVW